MGSAVYTFKDGQVFRGEFAGDNQGWRGQGILVAGGNSYHCTLDRRVLSCANRSPTSTATPADETAGPAEQRQGHLLVLYAGEQCRIIRGEKILRGGPGIPLFAGDLVESANESVELQARGGMAIRLRPYSTLEIPGDIASDRGVLLLRKGSITVDYQGDPDRMPFRIQAAGANFDVEGTTFIVEIDDAQGTAKVRVFEGAVSVSPDLPALQKIDLERARENRSDEEPVGAPLSSQELQAIAEAIQAQTLKVGANQEGALSPETRTQAGKLNEAIETRLETARQPQPDTKRADVGLPDTISKLEAAQTDAPQTFEPTPQETAELKLLITIDDDTFGAAMREAGESGGRVTPQTRASIRGAYDRKLDESATALQKELEADDTVRTREDLLKHYKFLEVVTFHDGRQKAGSIAAQAGHILILHAPDGVFRLDRADIQQVDFYDIVPE
jgi:hypothetical protein